MKFLSKLLLVLNLFFLSELACCQVPVINNNEKIIEEKIENAVENINYEYDFNDLTENLMYFIENPINLNDIKKDDLQKLDLLNDIQISNLLNYIENYGELLSIYELQMISGFNDYVISRILPFVYVGAVKKNETLSISDMFQNGRKSLLLYYQNILEEQKGYSSISESELVKNPNQRYLGSPYRFFTKFKYNYKNYLQYGFTADKDAGEEFFKGSQRNGFDFYSAHLFFRNNTWLKSFVIGDFHAQFGQGLTLWTGLSYSKTYDPFSVKKYPQGFKPYTSTNEYGFLRGCGTTFKHKKLEISLLASRKLLDANIGEIDTINNDIYSVTSFQETGYHRTYNEISDKNTITENIFGGNILYNKKQYQIGFTVFKSKYSNPIIKKIEPYNQFDFQGKENTNYGANFNLILIPFNFFGEISLSENQKKAYLIGLQGNIENKMLIAILFRKYDVGFQNIRSAAFGENSKNNNEQGFYIGAEYFIAKKWTISAYCDLFEFPWLRYNDDSPSVGSDYLFKINYLYNRKLNIYFQFREKNKSQNNSEATYIKQHDETRRRNLRINLNLNVSDELSFNSRFEWCFFTKNEYYNKNGFLIYQDLSYKFRFYPLKFSARYALFDTDSYDERIYAYENDVLYAFSIPSYYYKGSRIYFLIKWDVNKKIDLWFRFSQTYYLNKNKISSGLDEINGNTKSEIKTQLIIKF